MVQRINAKNKVRKNTATAMSHRQMKERIQEIEIEEIERRQKILTQRKEKNFKEREIFNKIKNEQKKPLVWRMRKEELNEALKDWRCRVENWEKVGKQSKKNGSSRNEEIWITSKSQEGTFKPPRVTHEFKPDGSRIKVIRAMAVELPTIKNVLPRIKSQQSGFFQTEQPVNIEENQIKISGDESDWMIVSGEEVAEAKAFLENTAPQLNQSPLTPNHYREYEPLSTAARWASPVPVDNQGKELLLHASSMNLSNIGKPGFGWSSTASIPSLDVINSVGKARVQAIVKKQKSINDLEKEKSLLDSKPAPIPNAVKKESSTTDFLGSKPITNDSTDIFLFIEHLCLQSNLTIAEILTTVDRYQYQRKLEQYGRELANNDGSHSAKSKKNNTNNDITSLFNSEDPSRWLMDVGGRRSMSQSHSIRSNAGGSMAQGRTGSKFKFFKAKNYMQMNREAEIMETIRGLGDMSDRKSNSMSSNNSVASL